MRRLLAAATGLTVGLALVLTWRLATSWAHRALLGRMDWRERISQRSGV